MKQMARGALALVALVGLTACVDDPQENINNDELKTLQAYPEVAWLKAGPDSTAFYFRLLNDFGYGTPTHLEVSDVQGPITVKRDSMFRSYYNGGGGAADTALIPYVDGHLQRFYVFQPTPGEASFKMTASNGVSTTVRIRIEASDLGAVPVKTAVPGQNIVLHAPPFQKFAQDAQVQYSRGARPVNFPAEGEAARAGTVTSAGTVVDRAADGSTLTFRAAADVYGKGGRTGQGGWTWYTGSAGWLYRAAVEGILGIRKEGGRLFVDPVLPSGWNGYTATLVLDGKKLSVHVDRADGGGWQASVNGSVIKSSNEGYLL